MVWPAFSAAAISSIRLCWNSAQRNNPPSHSATETAKARADGAHVDRILDNLINNALTYGGDPAHVVVTTTDGIDPALTVQDNGEGVNPADREHVFERFYRGNSKSVGSGLGLFISRQMAEAWGGMLVLESNSGGGAKFVLRLPSATLIPG